VAEDDTDDDCLGFDDAMALAQKIDEMADLLRFTTAGAVASSDIRIDGTSYELMLKRKS